eukprot:NODE_8025_length_1529_cov_6.634094.p1 GENE.NODE_8025_length_1529_cov_6.634094~~NODE_8025_length_1529_cov_6.634094.p1  ORF type:complete len:352 (+),score=66.19 NODE_8025_length_1529_cov_6.634094:153-1058(+)
MLNGATFGGSGTANGGSNPRYGAGNCSGPVGCGGSGRDDWGDHGGGGDCGRVGGRGTGRGSSSRGTGRGGGISGAAGGGRGGHDSYRGGTNRSGTDRGGRNNDRGDVWDRDDVRNRGDTRNHGMRGGNGSAGVGGSDGSTGLWNEAWLTAMMQGEMPLNGSEAAVPPALRGSYGLAGADANMWGQMPGHMAGGGGWAPQPHVDSAIGPPPDLWPMDARPPPPPLGGLGAPRLLGALRHSGGNEAESRRWPTEQQQQQQQQQQQSYVPYGPAPGTFASTGYGSAGGKGGGGNAGGKGGCNAG